VGGKQMILPIKNGNIYYEEIGKGQPIVLIHGAVSASYYYRECAKILSKQFRVITYDRCGNSKSQMTKDATYSLASQVDQCIYLIENLQLEHVILVGTSAGGEIALETYKKAPYRIEHTILYETPMLTMLREDKPDIMDWIAHMEELVSEGDVRQATREFCVMMGETDERAPIKPAEEKEQDRQNFTHFLRHEFSPFSYYEVDIDFFREHREKITAAVGEKSNGSMFSLATQNFAKQTGCELLHFAGYHNLAYDLPLDFANSILGVIMRKCSL
jgi:pimeloyl-ACP methyl ester carboxylesterase